VERNCPRFVSFEIMTTILIFPKTQKQNFGKF